jgi:hypothetical protein
VLKRPEHPQRTTYPPVVAVKLLLVGQGRRLADFVTKRTVQVRILSSFFLTPALILTGCLSAAAQEYTFEIFAVPFQNRATLAEDINNRGAIVGLFVSPDSRQRGFKRHPMAHSSQSFIH